MGQKGLSQSLSEFLHNRDKVILDSNSYVSPAFWSERKTTLHGTPCKQNTQGFFIFTHNNYQTDLQKTDKQQGRIKS